MEPTTTIGIEPKKSKTKLIVIILILVVILAVLVLLRSKTEAPTNMDNQQIANQQESTELNSDINNATTFDNESDLGSIDKEF
jgi:hypothetical protein